MSQNTLYYGDNLNILREYIDTESVDLIYLDPPFNSKRSYNMLFKEESGQESEAQITAFEDTWHWNDVAVQTYRALLTETMPHVSAMIKAVHDFIGPNQMMAYLVMMAARLVELHRVLKPAGSLYLHCDPTASHYLKVVLDAVFGAQNYRNEIVWKRTSAHANVIQKYGVIHDIIFYYSKSKEYTWNQLYVPYSKYYIDTFFDQVDSDGRRYARRDLTASIERASSGQIYTWKGITPFKSRCWAMTKERMDELDAKGKIHWPKKQGGMPRLKLYPEDLPGTPVQDIWDDIRQMHNLADERLGYPTQKPLALLERIIKASSNEDDIVLDPFCGCGTTIEAAQSLGRRWIGIDITHLAISLQRYRLKNAFPMIEAGKDYVVIGDPKDLASAQKLAQENRFQFQYWACGLVDARSLRSALEDRQAKKGADRGIDGKIIFVEDTTTNTPKTILIQVKSGNVGVGGIRDLRGTMERERAVIGAFLTLNEPTGPMRQEAREAGVYESDWGQHPRIQILTIQELLDGKKIDYPAPSQTNRSLKRARRSEERTKGTQGEFEF